MSESTAGLRRQLQSAGDLQSVVRTMKAMAASSIGQYEKSVSALGDYYRTIEQGLAVSFRRAGSSLEPGNAQIKKPTTVGAIVFGSDQGLVGQFNEAVASYAAEALAELPDKPKVWAVGERLKSRLSDAGLPPQEVFEVPTSVKAITPLIGRLLLKSSEVGELHLFQNQPTSQGLYQPARQKLLPLDEAWRQNLAALPWPKGPVPEVLGDPEETLGALVREYLFVSLFKACAESLASENASRLVAMQRAEKNIDELKAELEASFHRLRQSSIDEELFDVVAGVEALSDEDDA